MNEEASSVEVENALGKFRISSGNLNTLFTVLGFVATLVLAMAMWAHYAEAKDTGDKVGQQLREANKETASILKEANKDLARALSDIAQAAREQNCLLALTQQPNLTSEQRAANVELCKRISR